MKDDGGKLCEQVAERERELREIIGDTPASKRSAEQKLAGTELQSLRSTLRKVLKPRDARPGNPYVLFLKQFGSEIKEEHKAYSANHKDVTYEMYAKARFSDLRKKRKGWASVSELDPSKTNSSTAALTSAINAKRKTERALDEGIEANKNKKPRKAKAKATTKKKKASATTKPKKKVKFAT